MAHRIVPDHAELAAIHASACRYRRQGLVCSTCSDLELRVASCELRAAALRLAEVA
jgi:hypothetical protein